MSTAQRITITDDCGKYTVRLDYAHVTAEILVTATGESLVFMQGDEAESFVREYGRVDPDLMSYFLSDYDYTV